MDDILREIRQEEQVVEFGFVEGNVRLKGIMAYTTALLKVLEIWFSALIQKLVAITLSIPLPVIFAIS